MLGLLCLCCAAIIICLSTQSFKLYLMKTYLNFAKGPSVPVDIREWGHVFGVRVSNGSRRFNLACDTFAPFPSSTASISVVDDLIIESFSAITERYSDACITDVYAFADRENANLRLKNISVTFLATNMGETLLDSDIQAGCPSIAIMVTLRAEDAMSCSINCLTTSDQQVEACVDYDHFVTWDVSVAKALDISITTGINERRSDIASLSLRILSENGQPVWEVVLACSDKTSHRVLVSPTTGEIILAEGEN